MSDISNANWNENGPSNTSPSPNGWPLNQLPSTYIPTSQEERAALKRWYNLINAIYTTTGTSTAYLLTPTVTPEAYIRGAIITFFPHVSNTGASTITIGGLGAKQVVRPSGAALIAGDLNIGQAAQMWYDGGAFRLLTVYRDSPYHSGSVTASSFVGDGSALTNLNASNIASGTIADARLPTTLSAKTVAGNLIVNNGGNLFLDNAGDRVINFRGSNGSPIGAQIISSPTSNGSMFHRVFNTSNSTYTDLELRTDGRALWNSSLVWTAGNMGPSSGLNADLVDGYHASQSMSVNNIVVRDSLGGVNAQDVRADRGNGTGFVFYGNSNKWFGWDGTNYTANAGSLSVTGGNIYTGVEVEVSSAGNSHYWHKLNGVRRGLSYYDSTSNAMNWNLYNGSAAFVRALNFRESDGLFSVNGFVQADRFESTANNNGQGFKVGDDAWIGDSNLANGLQIKGQADGNQGYIKFGGSTSLLGSNGNNDLTWGGTSVLRNDGSTWNVSVNGTAGTLFQGNNTSSTRMQFNWSGQGGQPSWMWGGNDGQQMYVYNPSNFNVNYASTANNSALLSGVGIGGISQFSSSGNQNETNFPIGQILVAGGASQARRALVNLYLLNGDATQYSIVSQTTALAGSWRALGFINNTGSFCLYQRVS